MLKDSAKSETDEEELDWTWHDDDADETADEPKIESSHLQRWLIAVSPVGDVMVIADGTNATFLTSMCLCSFFT